jgi:hypothetical protein
VASAGGFLVYELSYTGPPEVYVPFSSRISANGFQGLPSLNSGSSSIYVPAGFNGRAWSGPWVSLGPGEYRVTFIFDNLSPNSSLTLDSINFAGNATFAERAVTFPTIGQNAATLDVSLTGIVP